jgi:hypothetical protein
MGQQGFLLLLQSLFHVFLFFLLPSLLHIVWSVIHDEQLAILAGDFLLARASLTLSKLENHEVTALMSTVIADLVEGEFMQTKQAERYTALEPEYGGGDDAIRASRGGGGGGGGASLMRTTG